MPAKDLYHEVVKGALIKDGWSITHDPFILSLGKRNVYVDLGAELPIAAERDGQKIAVEIKSFRGLSDMANLENALGQFVLYRSLLQKDHAEHTLYLAITQETFSGIFTEPFGQFVLNEHKLKLIVFDEAQEVIIKWI